eukprot:CAMPEP_0114486096 /NCGR_PEP_ID=MMETSP0109-20121206/37_1 /TAXON_ID=29199 /ORGANISM="Chlorarachnion reptans, Strain CCCM449" /LENGTH=181 /DNA_ID=CAMNT_0001662245 /DNA_START=64 /DNA_END=609 /DNA_ORIENTATION=-
MAGYTPLLDGDAPARKALRIPERLLTGVLLVNAALICLYLVVCSSASPALGAPMGRMTTGRASMPMMARTAPRTRVNAAITDINAFKKDIESRFPDTWSMKADGMYDDLMKQFDEKAKFIASESAAMDSKMLNIEDLEGQSADISTGVGGIIATVLLVGLPAATITGLLTGAISTVQPGAM